MRDVFYLRAIDPPVTAMNVRDMGREAGGCFDLHRVRWVGSFLATDGARLLCWYQSPDAESVRIALRQLGSDLSGVWPGTALTPAGRDFRSLHDANMAAEFSFDAPAEVNADGWPTALLPLTGDASPLEPVLALLASNRMRAVCLLKAADAGDVDAVRLALATIDPPPGSVWHCTALAPDSSGS